VKSEIADFAKGLNHLRLKKGWTQTDLEHVSSVKAQTISSIETGNRRASLNAQWALAKAFDMTPEAVIKLGQTTKQTRPNSDNLPGRLQKIIEKLGCNQADFADKIGVNPRTVNLWLTGQSIPRRKTALTIESVSGYYHEWLLDDDFTGPALACAQWAYQNKEVRLSLQQIAAIYERLNEILITLNSDKYKLLKEAKLNVSVTDDVYFIGHPPRVTDIKKIADATGYNPDWILHGHRPKENRSHAVPYAEYQEHTLPLEHTRNPVGAPSYAVTPDHLMGQQPTAIMMKVTPHLAPLVSRLELALRQEAEIKAIIQAIDRGDGDVIRSVIEVLNSGEIGTIMALKMNVIEFRQKVEERQELQKMKATLSHMKKRQDDLEMLLDRAKKDPPGLREPVDFAEND